MKIFLPMRPPTTTHQTKSTAVVNGKTIYYEDAKLKDARAKLTAHLGPHAPSVKFTGPLRVMVKWLFPMTAKSINGQWKATRPDSHNLNKLLFDVMTATGYWHDDAQVASEIIEKFHAETPGIFIQIEELEQPNQRSEK